MQHSPYKGSETVQTILPRSVAAGRGTLSCWKEVPTALADLQAQLIEGRLALTQG